MHRSSLLAESSHRVCVCLRARRIGSRRPLALIPLCLALAFGGCDSTYFGLMEQFGVHKRDILVDRVEAAQDAQEDAGEEFKSALDTFVEVLGVEGGELDDQYRQLDQAFRAAEARANEVRARIEAVESVSSALFDEWTEELSLYTDADYRRTSESRLAATRRRYDSLIAAMWQAESRIEPVLGVFRDQVLFLKHNLNARSMQAMRGELVRIEDDVDDLLGDLNLSIDAAQSFVDSLNEES